jgi:GntR family transcriptional regulator
MLIQVDKHSGIPVYRQVMEQVTRLIMSGQLSAGDQLESVAILAKRVKVNPMTVSKAYGFLVEEGLVERRPGVGLFVNAVREDKKRRVQHDLLERAMSRAAGLAVQLGLDDDEAMALFNEHFENNRVKQKRKAE